LHVFFGSRRGIALVGRSASSELFTGRSLRAIARSAKLEVVKLEWTGYCRMFSEEWINEEKALWGFIEQYPAWW
jgi:hypothetical protein